jgi:hypothetical protein
LHQQVGGLLAFQHMMHVRSPSHRTDRAHQVSAKESATL